MPDGRRAQCKQCERHKSIAGPITWTGLCVACAKANVAINLDGLMLKKGPALLHYRRSVAASAGAILVEDLRYTASTIGAGASATVELVVDSLYSSWQAASR